MFVFLFQILISKFFAICANVPVVPVFSCANVPVVSVFSCFNVPVANVFQLFDCSCCLCPSCLYLSLSVLVIFVPVPRQHLIYMHSIRHYYCMRIFHKFHFSTSITEILRFSTAIVFVEAAAQFYHVCHAPAHPDAANHRLQHSLHQTSGTAGREMKQFIDVNWSILGLIHMIAVTCVIGTIGEFN